MSLFAEGEVAQLSTAVQQWGLEEAAHTAWTDLQGEGLGGPVFLEVDETLAVVCGGVGEGPAFVGGRVWMRPPSIALSRVRECRRVEVGLCRMAAAKA